jgi:hypothetical protein
VVAAARSHRSAAPGGELAPDEGPAPDDGPAPGTLAGAGSSAPGR